MISVLLEFHHIFFLQNGNVSGFLRSHTARSFTTWTVGHNLTEKDRSKQCKHERKGSWLLSTRWKRTVSIFPLILLIHDADVACKKDEETGPFLEWSGSDLGTFVKRRLLLAISGLIDQISFRLWEVSVLNCVELVLHLEPWRTLTRQVELLK